MICSSPAAIMYGVIETPVPAIADRSPASAPPAAVSVMRGSPSNSVRTTVAVDAQLGAIPATRSDGVLFDRPSGWAISVVTPSTVVTLAAM